MFIKTVELAKEYGIEGTASLKCILHKSDGEMKAYNQSLPAMIVVPGGAYAFVSEREGDPVALNYFTAHYNAFVLRYDIAPDYRYPVALTQLAAAVDYVRTNAEELHVDPKRIYVSGFSAGGHLVANLANFYDNLPVPEAKGRRLDARPDAVVLGYPVIFYESHRGSFGNLLGENCTPEMCELLSLDARVTEKHPPCFIWTLADDTCVDPMATVRYTGALIGHKVTVESHIFKSGGHGCSTCDLCTLGEEWAEISKVASAWIPLSIKFLDSLG